MFLFTVNVLQCCIQSSWIIKILLVFVDMNRSYHNCFITHSLHILYNFTALSLVFWLIVTDQVHKHWSSINNLIGKLFHRDKISTCSSRIQNMTYWYWYYANIHVYMSDCCRHLILSWYRVHGSIWNEASTCWNSTLYGENTGSSR